MKKSTILLISTMLIGGLFFQPACKPNKGFDITNGSWGFFLTASNGNQLSIVYAFRGSDEEGDVIYNGEIRGTYQASRTRINFSVNHYGQDQELYVYSYVGTIHDKLNMSGTFTIQLADGGTQNGTFEAIR